jgi:ABC-2 type transport system ATP-binding protein
MSGLGNTAQAVAKACVWQMSPTADPTMISSTHHTINEENEMIELDTLTKHYGTKTVLDGLTFTVQPGIVTGFLGPNGAGKSTTMRLLLGLERPTAGTVTVNGRNYCDFPAPIREIGVLLEARAAHPARSARNHLLAMATTHDVPARRVDEVLDLVGLTEVARQRVGAFSLGMGQRLGIAGALLGDPQTIMLDEPVNGLDPEGIRWIRELLKQFASEGRTVFVSSHLMSEMALTAEHLIVVGQGRLIADVSVAGLLANSATSVTVRTPDVRQLRALLAHANATVSTQSDGNLDVTGLSAEEIGTHAAKAGVTLYQLTTKRASLEDTFMKLTADSVEYHGTTTKPTNDTARRAA